MACIGTALLFFTLLKNTGWNLVMYASVPRKLRVRKGDEEEEKDEGV
jgi:hypothetical protein